MNEKINLFLDSVCANIKYKSVHQDIRDELAIHINELKEEFLNDTQNEETALDMAISAMGDCDEIGRQLNKRHKPETEWTLIGLTAVIAIVGGIVMYTSSRYESWQTVDFERYLVFAILGIAVMTGLFFFDYTKLKKLSWPLYMTSLALLIAVLLTGNDFNGRRFFIIGGTAISTEFTTLLFSVSFVGFMDRARGKGIAGILKLGALAAISVFPIMIQSLTQALTLIGVYTVLIFSAVTKNHFGGSRKRQLALLGAIGCLCGFIIFGVLASARYRLARLLSFLSRGQADPTGVGYQQVMADKWLAASNMFGATSEKINGHGLHTTLPNVTTNYVLINVFATLGRVAGITLILIIVVYIGKMFSTTMKIRNSYGFYLSLASCTVIALQFITGILVNLNLLPTAGVYIPFISYGGVGYVVSMAFIGLILSVWRRNKLIPASSKNDADISTNFIKFDDGKLIVNLRLIRKS